ncbi:MAG: hypothetical protein KDD82_25350 [Planctomycetes bacterium]|nr:hypothetical protein [Planctomycetota bacterium]
MRTCLLALALVASVASADIEVHGSLDGQALNGTVRRVQRPDGSFAVEVTLSNGMTGQGTKVGAGLYRVTFPNTQPSAPPTVGLRGALLGETASGNARGETQGEFSMLLTNDGRELTSVVYKDGKPAGRLRAERRDPPQRETTQTRRGRRTSKAPQVDELGDEIRREQDGLTRNAPVFRQATATWGTARALWDLFKPGSRGLEELRGYSTGDDTQAMRAAMDTIPGPWTPAQIYRVARGQETSDRAALELAFGFLVDQRNLPLQQLPGIDSEDVHDKYEHYFASAILAHRSNATGSFAVGALKEMLDEVSGSGYSEDDLIADALGAEFGQELIKGKVIDNGPGL